MKFVILFLLSFGAVAAPAKKVATPPTPPADNKILWSAWYTVQVAGAPQGYYSEEVEERPKEKQISINQRWWERDFPLKVTETFIGSVSRNDGKLTPLAFYVEKKTDLGSTNREGRIKDGSLTVTLKPGDEKIKASLSKGTILSAALGLLMAEQGKKNNRKPVEFSAILEDIKGKQYNSQKGHFQLLGTSEQIRGETCYSANTAFATVEGKWWITKEGKLCRLLLPAMSTKVELADEAEAKGFLK